MAGPTSARARTRVPTRRSRPTRRRAARIFVVLMSTVLASAALTGCGLFGTAADGGAGASASPGVSPQTPLEPTPQESTLLDAEPDPNSTVGGLAPGFPSDLLPVPDGAEVLVSSVEPVGDSSAYQVSLNLRTMLPVVEVVDIYRQSLTPAGFTEAEQTLPDAALAAQSTFTRSGGDELLVIGVLDREGVRTVTIGGRLRAAG